MLHDGGQSKVHQVIVLHGHDALICHHLPDGHAKLGNSIVGIANQNRQVFSRHTGHQCLLELLLKGPYGEVRRFPCLFQHLVQQLDYGILLVTLYYSFLASFMSFSMHDATGLACLPEFLRGLIDGIAFDVPHDTIISMHVHDCKSYVCLPLSHCLKYGVNIGGIHLVQVCQNLPSSLDSLVEALKVPLLKMLQAVVHLPQHFT